MRRYDGMDDLLQSVRERILASKSRALPGRTESPFHVEVPIQDEAYDSVIGTLGVLLREAEQLQEMITGESARGLTEDQRDHILHMLGQVLEELWTAEACLQGVR